jgi:hypothetical protein
MSDYKETTRTRVKDKDSDRVTTTVYGICTSTADTSIPARGDFLDGVAGNASTHATCADIEIDPYWQHGRVLVVSRWVGHESSPTLGP